MSPRVILLVLIASVANAGLIPTVEVLQGPSSSTRIVGPDGSALSADAPGGVVVTNSRGAGLVAAGPALLVSGPEVAVSGPAGSIITSHILAGPAVVPAVVATDPAVLATPTVVTDSTTLLGDIESTDGAYIPDNNEALFDDGSYRGEH